MSIKTWIAPLVVSACVCGGRISAQELPPGSPYDALSSWSFGDTNSWKSDLGYKPLSSTNICMSELGDGPAVVVDSPSPAWLRYSVIDMGQTNLVVGNAGSLLFWFAPSWSGTNAGGGGPGVWGRLIEIGSYTTNASLGWWSLYTDPEGCNLFFSAQTNGATAVYLSAPISWETNRWHFVALTYSQTNASLYLDGTLATNASGVTVWPSDAVLTNGFCLGSSADGANQAHGMFDSLTTYGYVLTARSISNYFNGTDIDYWGNPMNTANLAKVPYDPPVPGPGFRAIMGSGSVLQIGIAAGCATNASVWMTNVTAKLTNNGTMNLTFKVGGGSPGVAYDVFGSDGLIGNSITNAEWVWLGQAYACSTNVITNLPAGSALFALGTDRDSDGDGLTDAFEALVSKTDPNNPDSDADGIPDWWAVSYFGTSLIDPWASPDGDGWNNYEKYIYGMNPRGFSTPPMPRDLRVTVNSSNWTATLTWQPTSGNILGYSVSRYSSETYEAVNYEIGPTNRFIDLNFPPYTNVWGGPIYYFVTAHYSAGDSEAAWKQAITDGNLSVMTLAGPSGTTVMRATYIPRGTIGIRLTKVDRDSTKTPANTAVTNFTYTVSDFTNGFLTLPAAWTSVGRGITLYYAQCIWTNGSVGQAVQCGPPALPFYDGRIQIAQNLNFLLRCANGSGSPTYVFDESQSEKHFFTRTNYAFSPATPADNPFISQYFYWNFTFDTNDLTIGFLTFGWDSWESLAHNTLMISLYPPYSFPGFTNSAIPAFLGPEEARWIIPYPDFLGTTGIGISTNSSGYTMQYGITNTFGLQLRSIRVAQNTNRDTCFRLLTPGQSAPPATGAVEPNRDTTIFYPDFDIPQLLTTGYYFTAGETPYPMGWVYQPPGEENFSPAKPQHILAFSLGERYWLAAYARQTIVNGDHTKPAYLGQYFEGAFRLNTNGSPTASQAGILSPYGDFLPTQLGSAALVTMTNAGANERGTNVIQIIGMFTDANHDGVIEQSFFGPDFVTRDHPFRFWVNDNKDSGDEGGTGIPGQPGVAADGQNFSYFDGSGYPVYRVHGTRDLVDFFPVYINLGGLFQSNALSAGISPTDPKYHFRLTQSDGALRFAYTTLTPTNYMNYLQDTNTAGSLSGALLTTITPNGVDLTNSFLTRIATNNGGILLVEAWKPTIQPLTLEIWQGTNLIVQTSIYLSIDSVEKMFRQKNLIRETFPSPTKLVGLPDRLTDEEVPNEPDTNERNFVFVHGYNVNPNQARGWFSDMYKRMYWSGSHAKFYGVNYDGYETQWPVVEITPNFETNLFNAFLTASNFARFMATMTNGETSVAAHSLGNVVVLSSLNDWQALNISNFFMIDAAASMQALDGTLPPNINLISPDWRPYTDRLYSSHWWRLFPTNDFRSTLTWSNRLAKFGSAQIYNFYSSGEEVLREYTDGFPPVSLISSVPAQLMAVLQGAAGAYTWSWQELDKGRCVGNNFLGSNHGGWGFNSFYDTNYFYQDGYVTNHMATNQAVALPNQQLRTNAFFNMSFDASLFGAGGSSYAQAHRDRILSDAIPALALPVGANPVARLAPPFTAVDRNIDMQTSFENGWPLGRLSGDEHNNWHHSDVRVVAYTFTYRLFDEIVNVANLK